MEKEALTMDIDLGNRKLVAATGIAVFTVLALGLGILTTSSQSLTSQPEMALDKQAAYDSSLGASGDFAGSQERKRATTMDIELEVRDVSEAQKAVKDLISGSKGYITSTDFNSRQADSGSMTVKIPDSNASSFVTALEGLGRIESKSKDVQDLTDQYDETQAELESKKRELQRLQQLMNRTDKVSELIKVQERISQVRSRIDYLEQRMQRLENRVSYTEIRIDFSEPTPFNTDFNPRETVNNAYQGFFNSIGLIVVGAGYLLPLVLLAAFVYGLVKAKRRYIG